MTTPVTLTDGGQSAGQGLKSNHLSFIEVVSQSIGVIAPSGTPGLVIPVVFATTGNGIWLAYAFATIALLIVSLQINGLLITYALVTMATLVFLYRRSELKSVQVLTALAAFALLAVVVVVGTVYLVPAWPYNVLPYIFLGLLLVGVPYFLALRLLAPKRLVEIEAEALGEA